MNYGPIRELKKILLYIACNVALVYADPIPLFVNYGTLTNTPQIDAIAFANYGTFQVAINGEAYEFSNTKYFTNRGIIISYPGIYFETVNDLGLRGPAEVFVNDLGGRIYVEGGSARGGIVPLLRINANKIINKGIISTSNDGLIEILGTDIDLSRSAVGVLPIISGSGSQEVQRGYYYPDEGITDQYWGFGEQSPRFASSGIITTFRGSLNARAPLHTVTNINYTTSQTFSLTDPYSFVYTNNIEGTNWIIQIVLVDVEDPNIYPQATFYRSSNPTNYFNTVTVQLATSLTNPVTGSTDLISLYLIDRLASETNYVVLTNGYTQGMPYRIGTFELTRNMPTEFMAGRPSNAVYRTNLSELVYSRGSPAITNYVTNIVDNTTNIVTNIVRSLGHEWDVVTNMYAAIGARVGYVVREPPSVPGASSTNTSGRIVIQSKNLNIEKARFRADGALVIQAENLISSKDAAVDAPQLFYSLGTVGGTLVLQSLAIPEVQRFFGELQAWSAVWTNQLNIQVTTLTNMPVETNITDPEGNQITITNLVPTNVVTTNVINVGIHVLFVNASGLQSRHRTYLAGFESPSTNIIVYDLVRVREKLALNAEKISIQAGGGLVLGNALNGQYFDWTKDSIPFAKYLTNYGLIAVAGTANMGFDRQYPYENIVNFGTNIADVFLIRSREFQNSGYMATASFYEFRTNVYISPVVGSIKINAEKIKLDTGRIEAGSDLIIEARELKLRATTNTASGTIVLDVTDLLTDGGPSAASVIQPTLGLNMIRKPAKGDLLGTTLKLSAQRFQAVPTIWAGEDRGPSVSGFGNNVALGRLVIDPQAGGTVVLQGLGTNNAMYVDYIEIGPSAISALGEALVIEPNLTVYFADANIPVEVLTNTFVGRLVWVNYNGPNSSVPVLLRDGRTIYVNRVFRNSISIDSDADGIANGYDPYPFDGPKITEFIHDVELGALKIKWRAAANTTYYIEGAASLDSFQWNRLLTVPHLVPFDETIEVLVPIDSSVNVQFLRISYEPGK